MGFYLDADQAKELQEWQETIKKCHGRYCDYDFTFTPTGIGMKIVVYSHLAGWSIDLSHEENW